jgi:hypothetical protein
MRSSQFARQTPGSQPAAVWLVLLALLASAGCGPGMVAGHRPPAEPAQGTVSGAVRGPTGTRPVEGRRVVAVNLAGGERESVLTNPAGTYTLLLPAGTYRLELELLPGETLVERPDAVEIRSGEIVHEANFVLTSAGPRDPSGGLRTRPGWRSQLLPPPSA